MTAVVGRRKLFIFYGWVIKIFGCENASLLCPPQAINNDRSLIIITARDFSCKKIQSSSVYTRSYNKFCPTNTCLYINVKSRMFNNMAIIIDKEEVSVFRTLNVKYTEYRTQFARNLQSDFSQHLAGFTNELVNHTVALYLSYRCEVKKTIDIFQRNICSNHTQYLCNTLHNKV